MAPRLVSAALCGSARPYGLARLAGLCGLAALTGVAALGGCHLSHTAPGPGGDPPPDASPPAPPGAAIERTTYENACRAIYNLWLVEERPGECLVLSVDGWPGDRPLDGSVLYLGERCPAPGAVLRDWATETALSVTGAMTYRDTGRPAPGGGLAVQVEAEGTATLEDGREIRIDYRTTESQLCCDCWP